MSNQQQRNRHWYRISVDTLKGWALLTLVAVGLAGGFVVYERWERFAMEREVGLLIDQARALIQELQGEEGLASFREEYQTGLDNLQAAQLHQQQGDIPKAVQSARRSRTVLQSILDALAQRGTGGEAHFVAVQGSVQFRQGDRGEWDEARSRVVLKSGDYVKTGSDGSAEIMFLDGTLYTVRPDTLLLVSRSRTSGGGSERTVQLEYGWVNLNTAQQPSTVTTPQAAARVEDDSQAMVTYDKSDGQGRFAAFEGALEVEASDGLKRRVEGLQVVTQKGSLLSEPEALPPAPQLLEPADDLALDMDGDREVQLSWREVRGARRYALQVSRNVLFVDNVIDVDNRTRASSRLGLRGEGSFVWRVSAIGDNSLQGPWSAPRRFRVASIRGNTEEADTTPPELELDDIQSYGSLFIVRGRTEPGARVWVNQEAASVDADGGFTYTVQLSQEGWAFIDIRAMDVWNNETSRRHRVFVEHL